MKFLPSFIGSEGSISWHITSNYLIDHPSPFPIDRLAMPEGFMSFKRIIPALCIWTLQSWAVSVDTLPAGIRSPSIRFGVVSGLNETYSQDGSLLNLGESRSVNFNAQTLAQVSPEARVLIDALNKFGSKNLGQEINLGTLKIDTKPEITYWSPVMAYGIKKNWTMALAIPYIGYKNKINLSSEPANLDFYRSQFSGISSELDQALNINLVQSAQTSIQNKGYLPLSDRNESFLGDIQVVSIYQFSQTSLSAWAWQTQLNLPTGPKYNSDDLMALNTFGRSSVDNSLIYSIHSGNFEFLPSLGATVFLPDQVTARVPKDENDTLPDSSQKEDVTRIIGASANVATQANYFISPQWTTKLAIELSNKLADSYSGSKNSRYDLLAANTESQSLRSRIGISYSSVSQYMNKKARLPGIASLEVSDTFYGQNTERRLQTELNLMMFF